MHSTLPNDLESRRPLWSALSELYLDNEPTERDIQWMIEVCAKSRYSLSEIERVLFVELYPALIGNLFSMAGEWAGFDLAWLEQRIVTAKRRWIYLPWWLSPVKLFYLSHQWRRIKRGIIAARRKHKGTAQE